MKPFTPIALISLLLALAACGGGGGSSSGGSNTPPAVPRFAYSANFDDGTISMFTVDAATGRLRHNGYILAGASAPADPNTVNPHGVALDPSGKFAFVTNFGSSTVTAYRIETNGRLTAVADAATGAQPRAVAVHPTGKFAYVANSNSTTVSAYAVDAGTGALSPISGSPFTAGANPFGVTIDAAGRFAYVANFGTFGISGGISAFGIDASTGALTPVDADDASAGMQTSIAAGSQPHSVALAPSARFLYAANFGDGTVSAYRVNAATGALTAVGSVAAGAGARAVGIDPSGKFAYVANHLAASISAYTINPNSGALTQIDADADATNGIQSFPAGEQPGGITVDPSGKFLYAANLASNDVSTYAIDAVTGALTASPAIAGRAGNLELAIMRGTAPVKYTPKFAHVGNPAGLISTYTIDATDGALTAGTSAAIGGSASSVTVDPSGRFVYAANESSNNVSIFSVDPASGALTAVGSPEPTGGTGSNSVAIDPSGRFAYVTNRSSGTVSAYTINATSGALTRLDADPASPGIQNFTAGSFPQSVAVDPSGRFAYAANTLSNTVSAYTINATTGALSAIGPPVTTAGSSAQSVVVEPTGRFAYVANGFSNTISAFRISLTSGALTAVGTPVDTGGSGARFITADPSGRFVYVTHPLTIFDGAGNVISAASNNVSAFTINLLSGALSPAGALVASGAGPTSVAVDLSGRFAYVANNGSNSISTYRIDSISGQLAPFGAPLSSQFAASVTTTGMIE